MCSIMGYCGSDVDYSIFEQGFYARFPVDRMTVGLWTQAEDFLAFTDLRLWGSHLQGCSPLHWRAAMLSAMVKFMALRS